MPAESAIDPTLQAELTDIYVLYLALMRGAEPGSGPVSGLGGRLLYAGELDGEGARLVRAANIAGAATLCAAPEPAQQRIAIREGVADFLVTTLEEALRILKNEIRKHNGVAVAVSTSAAQVMREMRERGVLPDLLRDDEPGFMSAGSQGIGPAALPPGMEWMVVTGAVAAFDSRVLELLPEASEAERRWLRMSQRYLGPAFRRWRSLPLRRQWADRLRAAFPEALFIPVA